jgi:hypothetical protein
VSCMYISFMPFMYKLITFHIIICIKAQQWERYIRNHFNLKSLCKNKWRDYVEWMRNKKFCIFWVCGRFRRKIEDFCFISMNDTILRIKKTWNELK